jgi:hypothetical protein
VHNGRRAIYDDRLARTRLPGTRASGGALARRAHHVHSGEEWRNALLGRLRPRE